MHFQRIKDTRIDNDFTQVEMAKILNCPQSTYNRYENGKVEFPANVVIKISEVLNVSCDYLLGMSNVKGVFYGVQCSIAQRLYIARRNAYMTQEQIASILICPREVYIRYESGKRTCPLEMITTLAKYYKVSCDYLLGLNVIS